MSGIEIYREITLYTQIFTQNTGVDSEFLRKNLAGEVSYWNGDLSESFWFSGLKGIIPETTLIYAKGCAPPPDTSQRIMSEREEGTGTAKMSIIPRSC